MEEKVCYTEIHRGSTEVRRENFVQLREKPCVTLCSKELEIRRPKTEVNRKQIKSVKIIMFIKDQCTKKVKIIKMGRKVTLETHTKESEMKNICGNLLNQCHLRSIKYQTLKLLFTILLVSFVKLSAQDALFTNYLNTPLQTNPALVAFDNDFKIALNYRGRISKFSQSYNTPVLSVVYPLINHDKSKRWGGIGFSVLADMSDNSQMIKTTGANLAFAYNLQLNDIQYISASLGAGYFRREVNINNLSTGSQYVPNQGYDPTIPINENFTNDTKGF
ncbi:MAG: PorP/SprF family type IX secretion system membrane protein [Chloroflexia bacterium]|nr:PorP/SprF family type IX secretion system membrane protein [Chloroflexia bacterium]